MTKSIVAAAITAACVAAIGAGPAHAGDGGRTTMDFALQPDLVTPVSCPGALFGFALGVSSPEGSPLGTGRSCVESIHGCEPFTAFCRRTVRSTLTLDLARGSLTAPLKLTEVLPTEGSFLQVGSGRVSAGTGAYSTAEGRIAGGGAGAFDDQLAFSGRLIYHADLRGVR
jgi:hypothetical protein